MQKSFDEFWSQTEKKYEREYLPFFTYIMNTSAPYSSRYRLSAEAVKLINRLISLIRKFRESETSRITDYDQREMEKMVVEIENKKRAVVQLVNRGADEEVLKFEQPAVSKSAGAAVVKVYQKTAEIGKTAGAAAANAYQKAAESAKNAAKRISEKLRMTGLSAVQSLLPALGPYSGPTVLTLPVLSKAMKSITSFVSGAFRKIPKISFDKRERLVRESAPDRPKEGKITEEEIRSALMKFYNRDAFRARWTKQLLEAIKKGEEDSAAGGFGRKMKSLEKILFSVIDKVIAVGLKKLLLFGAVGGLAIGVLASKRFRNAIVHGAKAVWGWIAEGSKKIWDWIVVSSKKLWAWTIDGLKKSWEWIKETSKNVWDWIAETANDLWIVIKEASGIVWDKIKEWSSAAWNWIAETAEDIWIFIKYIASETWDKITEWSGAVWDWISQTAEDIWIWLRDSVLSLWDAISSGAVKTWNWVTGTLEDIWSWIEDGALAVWDNIKNGVASLWNLMTSGIQDAWEAIKNGVKNIWKKILWWRKDEETEKPAAAVEEEPQFTQKLQLPEIEELSMPERKIAEAVQSTGRSAFVDTDLEQFRSEWRKLDSIERNTVRTNELLAELISVIKGKFGGPFTISPSPLSDISPEMRRVNAGVANDF